MAILIYLCILVVKLASRIICLIISISLCIISQANAALVPPQQCDNLKCVRNNIDQIDMQLIELIGQRFTNVKRAGELKQKNHQPSVHDEAREQAILADVAKRTQTLGYPDVMMVAIFKQILLESNRYENLILTPQSKALLYKTLSHEPKLALGWIRVSSA